MICSVNLAEANIRDMLQLTISSIVLVVELIFLLLPTGLTRTGGKCSDGSTLVPWSAGKCVLWDVKIANTMALSYAVISPVSAGLVTKQSSTRKLVKYNELAISLWSLLVLYNYVQKHLLFLVNLDVACR